MKHNRIVVAAALCLTAAISAQAQDTSSVRPKPTAKDTTKKDSTKTTTTSNGALVYDSLSMEWYVPTGTTCSTVDATAAKAVTIKSDLYKADMGLISPDSAKIVALCAVPGQIGSGEMNNSGGRTQYEIDIIPNDKKTHTKVIVDAKSGAVMSSKQFGGLRGLAGWVRESSEHKMNKTKSPTDTSTAAKPPVAKPPV
jgi:uncharacterized membrane protein YkoI